MPAVRSAAPEADLPDEDLLLHGAEHEEDQPDRGELNQDARRHAQTAQHFRAAEKHGEPGAGPDALRPLGRVLEMVPAAVQEHRGDHEPQQQQAHVAEPQQPGKRDAQGGLLSTPRTARRDSSTTTVLPAPTRRPRDARWPSHAWRRDGWGSCRSTGWRRTAGTCADGPIAP